VHKHWNSLIVSGCFHCGCAQKPLCAFGCMVCGAMLFSLEAFSLLQNQS